MKPRQVEQSSIKEAVDFWMGLGRDQDLRGTIHMWFALSETKESPKVEPQPATDEGTRQA